MIRVKSRGNETAEQMIRRFKKACEKEGLTKDIKRVAYYEKPSEKRRRRSRGKPRMKPVRLVVDFGFWIADFGLRRRRGLTPVGQISNAIHLQGCCKSKIQNRKFKIL